MTIMRKYFRVLKLENLILIFMLGSLTGATKSYAMNVDFEWQSSPNVDYYIIYWDTSSHTSSGTYASQSPQIFSPNPPNNTITYKVTGLPAGTYYFAIKGVNDFGESAFSDEICVLGPNHPDYADPIYTYDRGWVITSGDLKGTMFVYNSSDPTPTMDFSNVIPALDKPGVSAVGVPISLQHWTFNTPVKLFIPCPGYSDVSSLDIYYYDDVRLDWYLANDADDPDTVQPDAVGWMVDGSRENLSGAIAIKVNHFSGVQAGVAGGSQTISSSGVAGGGGGGCFISAIAERR